MLCVYALCVPRIQVTLGIMGVRLCVCLTQMREFEKRRKGEKSKKEKKGKKDKKSKVQSDVFVYVFV